MSLWIVMRGVKFLSLVAFAAGLALAAGSPRQQDRAWAVTRLAAPAMWWSWLGGYLLLRTSGRSITEPFVWLAVVGSLVALHGAALCAAQAAPSVQVRVLPGAGLGFATGVMVLRDQADPAVVVGSVVAAALGGALAAALPRPDGASWSGWEEQARSWFVWAGRLEGLSLLVLLVGMPLRRAAGIHLDGGTGALGWTHGALVLIYLNTVLTARRALGWSWATAVLAVAAALVPFGTFAFERFGPVRRTV